MKTSQSARMMALVLASVFVLMLASPMILHASSLDELVSTPTQETQSQVTQEPSNTGSDQSSQALTGYLRNYNQITDENMSRATQTMTPFTNVVGYFTGCILIIAIAGIGFTTACDLLYIAVPLLQPVLWRQGAEAQAGGMQGGMGMGGMGGYGMRGMGMGGQQAAPASQGWCLISSECKKAVAMANTQQQGAGIPMGGGMGMGGMGMGMGGMGMGGMGMGGQPQAQPVSTKSVIFTYLKSRMFFIIIFAVATIVLFSSVLMDCGINIAELILKLTQRGGDAVSNFNL